MKSKNPLTLIIKNYHLLATATLSEIKQKNAGSILGNLWLILAPLLFLSIYSVIYIVIFNLKPISLSQQDYVLYIFCGLVPFMAISESLTSSAASLLSNKSLLKNTVFPIEILPTKSVLLSHVGFIPGIFLIILFGIYLGHVSLIYLFIPIILILQLMFLFGLGWLLSLINIVLRDTQQFLFLLVLILMVASPIAYLPDMVPERLEPLISWNPFAKYIISYQSIIVYESLPSLSVLISMSLISIITFFGSFRLFLKIRGAIVNYV